jgi:16S rRNA (uracil1498-N3)-methyltransferase
MIGELFISLNSEFMARQYRFFIENSGPLDKNMALNGGTGPEIVEQLSRVLRAKAGDRVVLVPLERGNNKNEAGHLFEYHYVIETAHKKEVSLSFTEKVRNANELPFSLGLVLCLPNKPDKLSLILQKAVELGVSWVHLVTSDFSRMKHALREERLLKIMTEAAEQSERALVPTLMMGGTLRDYLRGSPENLFIAMEREDSRTLPEVLEGRDDGRDNDESGSRDVLILIGPEGGFSYEEKNAIHERGLTCFTLGKRVLRMETAAVVALGIASLLR